MAMRMILSIASLLVATACTPLDPTFGGSAKALYAQQIIDPEPADVGRAPGSDATLGAKAVQRYRTDAVKKPATIRTTSGVSGGGNGGGPK